MKGIKKIILVGLLMACSIGIVACGKKEANKDESKPKVIRLDYAYYNPLSLVLKNKGFLEESLASENIKVEWIQSLGSNKALELLNSKSIDFGSTAGSAALIGRANGNPIEVVYVYSKPEWTALVTNKGSNIKTVSDLKGKKIAVTKGTDPYVFLVTALEKEGLTEKDVQIVAMQHQDGKNALITKQVDAWVGLDPLMAQAEVEHDCRIFYRDQQANTYGVIDVTEHFASTYPDYVEKVLAAYEEARQWAKDHPQEFQDLFVKEANLTEDVAKVVLERTDFTVSIPNEDVKIVMANAGQILLENDAIDSNTDIQKTIKEFIHPEYAQKNDRSQ